MRTADEETGGGLVISWMLVCKPLEMERRNRRKKWNEGETRAGFSYEILKGFPNAVSCSLRTFLLFTVGNFASWFFYLDNFFFYGGNFMKKIHIFRQSFVICNFFFFMTCEVGNKKNQIFIQIFLVSEFSKRGGGQNF